MPTVLITGASRGMGLEFARQYAADGWRVIATCRDPAGAAALAATEGAVEIRPLDVGDAGAVGRLAAELQDTAIDVLLLNAAIHPQWQRPPADETDFDVWPEAFRINAIAPVRVAAALAENVARSERRVIAAMSSAAGSIARKAGGNYVYASSKAALNLCVRGLASEWRPRGLIVVALAPGGVRTDMNRNTAARLPAEAVGPLRTIIENLTPADSGRFINYDGADMLW